MKGIYSNLAPGITHPYSNTFSMRFTCGSAFKNDVCDIITDSLQRTFVIQFLKKDGPSQRLVISKDLILNTPFKNIIQLIELNYHNIIQFNARDFLSPKRAIEHLFEQFSAIKVTIGNQEIEANLTAEQTIAVLYLHIDKLYLDTHAKGYLKKCVFELAQAYV